MDGGVAGSRVVARDRACASRDRARVDRREFIAREWSVAEPVRGTVYGGGWGAALTYLTRWRMYRARVLLRDEQARVSEVARALGYGSETAFSTAFKREVGLAPRNCTRTAE